MAATLTQRAVEAAKPEPKRREIPDGALPGFYLVVQPTGRKAFVCRFRVQGVSKKLTLGAFPRLSLGEAREAARAALGAASQGQDPTIVKASVKQEVLRNTFGGVAAEYVRRHAKSHHRTWRETERLLTRADLAAAWTGRYIGDITRRDVLDLLDAVVERGSPVQANRLVTRLRPFFAWCVQRGILESSPLAGIRPPSPETARDRVLSDAELVAVWEAAEEEGYPFGRAIQLLIRSGQRRSEVLDAEWAELDFGGRVWTIPKERSKTGVAHVVPLSGPAVDLVKGLPRIGTHSRLLFTTNGLTPFSGVSKAFARLTKRAAHHLGAPLEPWRPHDLRRSFASGCARLGVPVHVVEKALNHTSGTFGGIVGVYQRHEFLAERRQAMDLWGAHVTELISPNVIPLRRSEG